MAGNVRFARIHGRIVPIRGAAGGKVPGKSPAKRAPPSTLTKVTKFVKKNAPAAGAFALGGLGIFALGASAALGEHASGSLVSGTVSKGFAFAAKSKSFLKPFKASVGLAVAGGVMTFAAKVLRKGH